MSLLSDFVNNRPMQRWPRGSRLLMLGLIAWTIAILLSLVIVFG